LNRTAHDCAQITPQAVLPTDLRVASDKDLLGHLIGVQEVERLYRGKLQPFFENADSCQVPVECLLARELVKRWLAEDLTGRQSFPSPNSVKEYLKLHFAGRQYESFVALYLDAQNCMLGIEELFRGTLTQTSVYPREVVKAALRINAASVMFSHNHPSGSTTPSRADEHLTQTLKAALALVDVRVLDHFVVAGTSSFSFAERGLI
jgi:DNA repair protein RadC